MMRQNHGAWAYPPRPQKSAGRISLVLTVIAAIVVGLAFGHVATKAVANLAYHNVYYSCGAC